MDIKQEVRSFAGSTTHPGRYLCTYVRVGGMWMMIGMDRVLA